MDATQVIDDSMFESDEEENEEENGHKRGEPLAKLRVFKNEHMPETELPLYLGDNVLGRDPNMCTLLLPAPSVSKQHSTICISVLRGRGRHGAVVMEALVWDLGSMNGTCKGYFKLTPHVRYALSEGDRLVMADIPCQYVGCAVDKVSDQGNTRTPVNGDLGERSRGSDALREKGCDTCTDSENGVNRDTKVPAIVSSPGQEETSKTPARTRCLTFEQTPTQPEGTLVPESDSDSDGERRGRKERRAKARVSESDSHISSPSCSTFVSPTNKIIPESEDESPITPYSSTKNRNNKCVGFSEEERDVDVGRQQLKKKRAQVIVDSSEEEEERAAPGGSESEQSGQDVPMIQENNVNLCVSAPAVSTDAMPVFNVDSDTDVEGEEEGVESAGPVTFKTSPPADRPTKRFQIQVDSDTDVDEDDDALDNGPKSVPVSNDVATKTDSPIKPTFDITFDRDSDVADGVAAVLDTATKATVKPTSLQSVHAADSAPSTQPKDFHLDSDTDVDEEEENDSETENMCLKIDETPSRRDSKPSKVESTSAVVAVDTKPPTAAHTRADMILNVSDSDTDVEDGAPLRPGFAADRSTALQSDSDADTDVDEPTMPPARVANFRLDSDTDAEDEGAGPRGVVEEMETQAFVCDQRPVILPSSSSDSQQDNDFLVAETQSFILDNLPDDPTLDATQAFDLEQCSRGGSFQRGLSDSSRLQAQAQALATENTQAFDLEQCSRLQAQAQALATENTQAFVTLNVDVNMEETQAYGNISLLDGTSVDDSSLEATQAYGGDEEPARCSTVSENESWGDVALEATQAYVPESHSGPQDETEGDERTNIATAETQDFPTTSAIVMAETQPMSAFEEEENVMKYTPPSSSVHRRKTKKQNEREERGEATQPLEEMTMEYLSTAETQPMTACEDEESDDEDLIPAPRKKKAKPLQLEEEETQPITSSELCDPGTQSTFIRDHNNEDGEVTEVLSLKRRGRPQTKKLKVLTSTYISNTEDEHVVMDEEEEHEEAETKAGPQKAKRQSQRGKPRESEAGTSGISSRITRGSRARLGEDERQEEPPKRQTRGKGKALPTTRGRRGKVRPQEEEEESEEEEEVEQAKQGRGRKPTKRQEEKERLEMERKAEKDRLLKEQEEKERIEEELREQERANSEKERRAEQDKLEEERKKAEQERLMCERAEREEKLRLEQERAEKEEKERLDREREERERLEREEKERLERERKEQEEKEEQERLECERKEKEERERLKCEREEKVRLEQARAEREEKERLEREEKERVERERKEQEEKERFDRIRKEKEEQERLESERKEMEERERVKREKAEREEKERLEREEKDRIEREREEKDRLERVRKEAVEQARLEREKKEREEENREKGRLEKEAKEMKEQQENKEEETKLSARGRRSARRTVAAPSTTEPDSTISTSDDVPARRTRSRSNSSNSISSEMSASSVTSLGSRGRGAKKTSQPALGNITRDSRRRTTAAAAEREATEPGILSRSNLTNSLNSEVSSCSVSSQNGGRGRGRGRGRKTEPATNSVPLRNSQSDQNSAPNATARGRKSRKAEVSSNDVARVDGDEKADSQQLSTTNGRSRASASGSGSQTQVVESSTEDSLLPKRNVRGRGQTAIKRETLVTPVAAVVNGEGEAKGKGRKRELEEEAEEDENRGAKVSRGKAKAQKEETEAAEEEETKEEIPVPVPAKRRGRPSATQGRRNAIESCPEVEVKEENEKMEEEIVERKARGRPSVARKKKDEKEKEGGTSSLSSVDQDTSSEASEVPQTTTSSASRKRAAPRDSPPVAKNRRSLSGSPRAGGRPRAASQAYKVLFTGVTDEAGERVVPHLGGSFAKGVVDMTCLVTDKVRRTVKFLCAVARGVPIVTTHWLEKSGKAGSFLSPNAFIVKDTEQEKKFNFCLQESLRIASIQPLLQGYEIHVTKSVKPEPVHMKDIISCSGAIFLPKMPSAHKAQTLVVSCEEDWSLCGPAVSASLPVVTAEFILTGILQQKIDFNTHTLPAPTTIPHAAAAGRGRGRKKT
ncbi:mediator of DNA damage checkpoint protein 1 [Diretmus argenteus]